MEVLKKSLAVDSVRLFCYICILTLINNILCIVKIVDKK